MKILAIRGQNLASLSKTFAIELDQAPLSEIGLFAITGPTGAGKSTILDAMCLALYNQTPRLRGRGGAYVGAHARRVKGSNGDVSDKSVKKEEGVSKDEPERIRDTDVRALLSRGSSQGYAEVDFLGVDGLRYRARWSVRRARNRAKGKLQAAQMQLVRCHDEANLSSNKITETLESIRDKVGLGFEQFCRSVLLSQGDFAAFLRADDNERAQLLERMTGTEIYRQLSRACHAKHRHWQQQLQEKRGQMQQVALLPQEERLELQAQSEAAKRGLGELQNKIEKAQGQLHAARARLELQARAQQSEQDLAKVQKELEAAVERRKRVQRFQAIAPLRAIYEEHKKREDEQQQLCRRVAELEADQAELAKQAAQLGRACDDAAVELKAWEQQSQARMPQLERAKLLDAEIKDLGARSVQSQQDFLRYEKAQKEAKAALVQHSSELEALQKRRAGLCRKKEEQEAAQALWQQRKETEAGLLRWLGLQNEAQQFRTGYEQQKARLDQLRTQIRPEMEAVAQQQVKLKQAQEALLALGALGEAQAEERWSQGRELLREIYSEHKRLLKAWEQCVKESRDFGQGQLLVADGEQELELQKQAAKAAREGLLRIEGQREEAQRGWLELQKTASFEEQRAQLQDNEPCPLCGSKDHPFREGPQQWQVLLQRGKERHEQLSKQQQQGRKALERAETQAAGLRERIYALRERNRDGQRRFLKSSQELGHAAQGARRNFRAFSTLFAKSAEEAAGEFGGTSQAARAPGAGGEPPEIRAAKEDVGGQGLADFIESLRGYWEQWSVEPFGAEWQTSDKIGDKAAKDGEHDSEALRAFEARLRELGEEDSGEDSLLRVWVEQPAQQGEKAQQVLDRIENCGRELKTKLEGLQERRRRSQTLQSEVAECTKRIQELQQRTQNRRNEENRLGVELGRLETKLQAHKAQLEEISQRMETRLGTVGLQLDDETKWEGDEVAQVEARSALGRVERAQSLFRDWLQRYEQQRRELETVQALEQQMLAKAQPLAQTFSAATARYEDCAGRTQELSKGLEQKKAQRGELLSGQTVAEYVEQQEKQRHRHRLAHESAAQRLEACRQKRQNQHVLRKSWGENLEALDARLKTLGQELADGIEASGINVQDLLALLEIPFEEVQKDIQALQELDQRAKSAREVLLARSKDLEMHRQTYTQLEAVPSQEEKLQELREILKTGQERYSEYRVRLEADTRAQQQREKLGAEVGRIQRQAEVWAQMHELIGHSDGQKFQRFAQSLTLDQLVALANRHLVDLDRRYRLQRVPGERLNLQVVDTFMADEIRSVNSLSGGESFLVSMALALGLSSLSATTTRIESLFIDEGFGTLDRESLDRAISALDALQATGRQIGMISHVEGLAEQLGAQLRVTPLGQGRSEVRLQSR